MSCPTCGDVNPKGVSGIGAQWCSRCGTLWFGDWITPPTLVERVREVMATREIPKDFSAHGYLGECVYPPEKDSDN